MAIILLDPNETFEHFHAQEGYTTLIEGEAIIRIGEREDRLVPGRSVFIPAHLSHDLRNIGKVTARFACTHAPAPGPG